MNVSHQDAWFDKVVSGWDKSDTRDGIPYYINHTSERTSWDHPYFVKILDEMHGFNSVKYAAYRTALKLTHLQKRLLLHQISFPFITSTCQRLGFAGDDVLTVDDLSTLISGLYAKCDLPSHLTGSPLNGPTLCELLLNLLLNLYDVKRSGCVRLTCVKVALVVFSNAKLSQKYTYLFHMMVGSQYHLSRQNMYTFLQDLLQIPELLGERGAFCSDTVTAAVNSCFELASNGSGVTEEMFCRWLVREPQTVVWLPTMHRVAASESVLHDAKCNICKCCPITGFRYKCLKCFHFDICQQCFFTGRTTKGHKLKHPIQEYCTAMTSRDDAKVMVKTLKNKLRGRRFALDAPTYLPIDTQPSVGLRDRGRISIAEPDPHRIVLKAAQRLEQLDTNAGDAPWRDSQGHEVQGRDPYETLPKSLQTSMIASTDSKGLQTSFNLSNVQDTRNISSDERHNTSRLLSVIDNLQSENRQLQRALESRRRQGSTGDDSDDASILSYTEQLEERREVLEARNEVLQEYNVSLSRQLMKVQQTLKGGTIPREPTDGVVEPGVALSCDSPFPAITPIMHASDGWWDKSENSLLSTGVDETGRPRNRNLPDRLESTPCAPRYNRDGGLKPGPSYKGGELGHASHGVHDRQSETWPDSSVYRSPPLLTDCSVNVTGTSKDATVDAWRSIDMMNTASLARSDHSIDQSAACGSHEAQLNELVAEMDDVFAHVLSSSGNSITQPVGVTDEMLTAVRAMGDALQDQITGLFDGY